MRSDLVTRFCTPPDNPVTAPDRKALSGAEQINVPFEGGTIRCYSWGEGPIVLLAHGWGSRASHLALIGRALAAKGFRVVAYDAPAHTSTEESFSSGRSNMFEFCRALSAVARFVGDIYAVVGHSLGAAVAAFTVAGYERMEPYQCDAARLVLLSTPASVMSVIDAFGVRHELDGQEKNALLEGLESEFRMTASVFSVGAALRSLSATRVLMIHDSDDEEFPVYNAYAIHREAGDSRLVVTEGNGHSRIVASRRVIRLTGEFLLA